MTRPSPQRNRGLTGTEVVACVAAALGIGLVIVLLSGPPGDGKAGGVVSDTAVFMAGSGTLYKQAQKDAQVYIGMLNPSGPMAEAMGGTGAVTGPMAGRSIGALMNVAPGAP